MTASSYRQSRPSEPGFEEDFIPEIVAEEMGPSLDPVDWEGHQREVAGAGGRAVLGWALALLALAWTGYSAWSAGRALAAEPLTSPAIAQWIAILAGPLALMGLTWLMFGRTRRREAEHFTRSVIAMRREASALQDLLGALSRQIDDNHRSLGVMAGDLMGLGDEAARRIGAVTQQLEAGSSELQRHGDALDRAAESARTDIGVLLADLPRAEESARAMAEALRHAGREAVGQAEDYKGAVDALAEATRAADHSIVEATQRLAAQIRAIDEAGSGATTRLTEGADQSRQRIETLLSYSADALDRIRSGIDQQAEAVTALLDRGATGIERAGVDAAEAIATRIDGAHASVERLAERVAEQDRLSNRMVADLDLGLAALGESFQRFASEGDERAARIGASLATLREQMADMAGQSAQQDEALSALDQRTRTLREGLTQVAAEIRGELGEALAGAEAGGQSLARLADELGPKLEQVRVAATDSGAQLERSGVAIEEQHERLSALMSAVDSGVGLAQARLGELSRAVGEAHVEAQRLAGEAAPAMIAALAQVRETAAHAGERAREAIAAVIPQAAGRLGEEAQAALEKAVREAVEDRLVEVDRLAARAVESARAASERLTGQMISIGQSAAALEDHVAKVEADRRAHDSENFARRVELLIDSMHSAAIDVTKILSDELDEKAWASYLKGNRGIFTRRAAKLVTNSESRAIAAHYEADADFQQSVNRYVHDYEAMLRRVMAEREGGMMAVALMGSDMGKLYVALAQAIDRKI